MNATVSTQGALKNGGITQIIVPFMHCAHPLLNCVHLCLIVLRLCLITLSLYLIAPVLYRIPPFVHFSTLSSCPNGMIRPHMLTPFPSPSSHSAGKCSFMQAGGHSWLIRRATMMTFLCNYPLDLMERWRSWGLSLLWSLRNPLLQPQKFQELETACLNTTNCQERAIIGF